jgi:SAM-dependent methyltransferase
MALNYSKHIGGIVEKFVEAAIPYSHWGTNYFNIRLMELVLVESLLGNPISRGGSRFLDFGCGIGLSCVYAAPFFKQVDGVDIEEIGVAFNVKRPSPVVGAELVASLGIGNVTLVACDTFTFLDDHPGAYDFIFSVFVLEHIEDIEGICGRLARAMAPGGRAVHIVPNTHDTIIQLLQQNLRPDAENERNIAPAGRGLKKMGNLFAPITHSEFIEDYNAQFEVNALERFLFPMIASGLKVQKISPIREHSYAILVEKPQVQ